MFLGFAVQREAFSLLLLACFGFLSEKKEVVCVGVGVCVLSSLSES